MRASRISKWAPSPEKADRECSLLELFARFYYAIQSLRAITESTMSDYATALAQIEHLEQMHKPAHTLNAYDIWDAVTSVRLKPYGKHAGEPYALGTIAKRLVVIHDIFLLCEAKCICNNPLWMPPWQLINAIEVDYSLSSDDIKTKVTLLARKISAEKIKYLGRRLESKIVNLIIDNITTDHEHPWMGLAILIYAIIRPAEVCALFYSDFYNFTMPSTEDRMFFRILSSTNYSSGELKPTMKTVNSPRLSPVHIELQALIDQYIASMPDYVDNPPMACFGCPDNRCSAEQLLRFVKEILSRVFTAQDLHELALLTYAATELDDYTDGDSYDCLLQSRIFRRHSITMYNAVTPMIPDSEIRPISGHETDEEYTWDYLKLAQIMCQMDHRMISEKLHGNSWIIDCQDGDLRDTVYAWVKIPADLVQRGGKVVINVHSIAPGDSVTITAPKCVDLQYSQHSTLPRLGKPERVLTDSITWPVDRLEKQRKRVLKESEDACQT